MSLKRPSAEELDKSESKKPNSIEMSNFNNFQISFVIFHFFLCLVAMISHEGRITRRRSSMLVNFVPLQPSPFDNLPNEVIINILCYLDKQSLKNALAVDTRFNSIATNSLKVMKHLPLTVGLFKGAKNRDITEFHRRYQSINFKRIPANKWFKYMKQSLERIGKDVQRVNFEDCHFREGDFSDIISCFPNAEKLNLVSIGKFIDVSCDRIFEPQEFPKLKQLKLEFVTSVKDLHNFIFADLF